MSDTSRQKAKKNGSRKPASMRPFIQSMQKNYGTSKKKEIEKKTKPLF